MFRPGMRVERKDTSASGLRWPINNGALGTVIKYPVNRSIKDAPGVTSWCLVKFDEPQQNGFTLIHCIPENLIPLDEERP